MSLLCPREAAALNAIAPGRLQHHGDSTLTGVVVDKAFSWRHGTVPAGEAPLPPPSPLPSLSPPPDRTRASLVGMTAGAGCHKEFRFQETF